MNLIICGNGNVFPWLTSGPDAEMMMHGIAVGLCQGTIIPNVGFDVGTVNVKRLLREQKPRKIRESKPLGGDRLPAGVEVRVPLD